MEQRYYIQIWAGGSMAEDIGQSSIAPFSIFSGRSSTGRNRRGSRLFGYSLAESAGMGIYLFGYVDNDLSIPAFR